jgi:hypothetical protein
LRWRQPLGLARRPPATEQGRRGAEPAEDHGIEHAPLQLRRDAGEVAAAEVARQEPQRRRGECRAEQEPDRAARRAHQCAFNQDPDAPLARRHAQYT